MIKFFLIVLLVLFFPTVSCFSDSEGISEKTRNGFSDLMFGWTELPKRIVQKTKETNPLQGLLLGTWEGTAKALARTTNGVADMVTFPIGKYERPAVFPDISKPD